MIEKARKNRHGAAEEQGNPGIDQRRKDAVEEGRDSSVTTGEVAQGGAEGGEAEQQDGQRHEMSLRRVAPTPDPEAQEEAAEHEVQGLRGDGAQHRGRPDRAAGRVGPWAHERRRVEDLGLGQNPRVLTQRFVPLDHEIGREHLEVHEDGRRQDRRGQEGPRDGRHLLVQRQPRDGAGRAVDRDRIDLRVGLTAPKVCS